MDERALAERLIAYDTSTPDGLRAAAGFVKGWLESREIDGRRPDHNGLPVILADGRPADGPDRRPPRPPRRRPGAPGSSRRASRATGSSAAAPTT